MLLVQIGRMGQLVDIPLVSAIAVTGDDTLMQVAVTHGVLGLLRVQ